MKIEGVAERFSSRKKISAKKVGGREQRGAKRVLFVRRAYLPPSQACRSAPRRPSLRGAFFAPAVRDLFHRKTCRHCRGAADWTATALGESRPACVGAAARAPSVNVVNSATHEIIWIGADISAGDGTSERRSRFKYPARFFCPPALARRCPASVHPRAGLFSFLMVRRRIELSRRLGGQRRGRR